MKILFVIGQVILAIVAGWCAAVITLAAAILFVFSAGLAIQWLLRAVLGA